MTWPCSVAAIARHGISGTQGKPSGANVTCYGSSFALFAQLREVSGLSARGVVLPERALAH